MNATFKFNQASTMKFLAKLDKTQRAVIDEADRGLNMEGEFTVTDAKEQTPVQWGTLKSSGIVIRIRQLLYRLEFGGAARLYALYVHEDLSAKHTTGNAKFLERALKKAARGMAGRIAARIKRKMG